MAPAAGRVAHQPVETERGDQARKQRVKRQLVAEEAADPLNAKQHRLQVDRLDRNAGDRDRQRPPGRSGEVLRRAATGRDAHRDDLRGRHLGIGQIELRFRHGADARQVATVVDITHHSHDAQPGVVLSQ